MLLGGDFNTDFSSEEVIPLILFLREKFDLVNNDRKIPTTNSKTTMDAVFSKYLDQIQSEMYISYFSSHKPIISCIKEIEEK